MNVLQWLLVSKEEQPAMRAEALAASEAALRLDPELPEAHVARANVLSVLGRQDEADEAFRKAIALGPSVRDAWYSYARFLFSMQRYDDAVHAYEKAARLNPDDYDALTLAAMPYEKLGKPDQARRSRERAVEAAERVLRNSPDDVRARYLSGASLVALGKRDEGFARLEEAIAIRPTDFSVLYNAACSFAIAGKPDRALDVLDVAVGTGKGFRAWMEHDPDLDSLRDLPRFQQILARLPQ